MENDALQNQSNQSIPKVINLLKKERLILCLNNNILNISQLLAK